MRVCYMNCSKCGKRITMHHNGILHRHFGLDYEPCDGRPTGKQPLTGENGATKEHLQEAHR